MRAATITETAAWLAGHLSIPGAIETDHGLMIPTTEPEPWAREALAGMTSEDDDDTHPCSGCGMTVDACARRYDQTDGAQCCRRCGHP